MYTYKTMYPVLAATCCIVLMAGAATFATDLNTPAQQRKAMAVGIHNAQITYHAGAIAEKANDIPGARRHFEQVVRLDPHCEWARKAQNALQILNTIQRDGSAISPSFAKS